jgi:hypothetical protein
LINQFSKRKAELEAVPEAPVLRVEAEALKIQVLPHHCPEELQTITKLLKYSEGYRLWKKHLTNTGVVRICGPRNNFLGPS